jgi:hypothetical protein
MFQSKPSCLATRMPLPEYDFIEEFDSSPWIGFATCNFVFLKACIFPFPKPLRNFQQQTNYTRSGIKMELFTLAGTPQRAVPTLGLSKA